jgi:hypothetical protein
MEVIFGNMDKSLLLSTNGHSYHQMNYKANRIENKKELSIEREWASYEEGGTEV